MTIQNQTPTPKQSHPSRRLSSAPACAACKHQRHRCAPLCTLAPYFPANQQREFLEVHRLFGISRVVNLLKMAPENMHDDAIKSLKYEANIRTLRPVGGCYSVIVDLKREIAMCQAELQIIKKTIAYQRARLQQNVTYYDIAGHSVDDLMPFFQNQEYSSYRNQEFNNNDDGGYFFFNNHQLTP